jgi:DNA processing protein
VLASGVLNIFPPEHDKLADEVAAHGAVVSEVAPTMPPLSGMFPQRNRIISGLSLGAVIVEAADRSGALITARHAMEQGRKSSPCRDPSTALVRRGHTGCCGTGLSW